MSANAATERHADAEKDEEDLPKTKDLPHQGTEDVDGRNARHMEDPCMSLETSAEGNSAECTDGTQVLLTGAPHKTRNKLQNSLPLTLRLPIEGEPSGCKQEAVESVVTAGCMNGTVEKAEPQVVDTDVDRTALLGGELAERASGVDEGDRTERRDLQLQQTNLLCEETRQCNGNAEDNIPIANRLPLEGEWTVYSSGEMKNLNGGDAG